MKKTIIATAIAIAFSAGIGDDASASIISRNNKETIALLNAAFGSAIKSEAEVTGREVEEVKAAIAAVEKKTNALIKALKGHQVVSEFSAKCKFSKDKDFLGYLYKALVDVKDYEALKTIKPKIEKVMNYEGVDGVLLSGCYNASELLKNLEQEVQEMDCNIQSYYNQLEAELQSFGRKVKAIRVINQASQDYESLQVSSNEVVTLVDELFSKIESLKEEVQGYAEVPERTQITHYSVPRTSRTGYHLQPQYQQVSQPQYQQVNQQQYQQVNQQQYQQSPYTKVSTGYSYPAVQNVNQQTTPAISSSKSVKRTKSTVL
jgi:outer membrane murein-binding lipoprotein Lpp